MRKIWAFFLCQNLQKFEKNLKQSYPAPLRCCGEIWSALHWTDTQFHNSNMMLDQKLQTIPVKCSIRSIKHNGHQTAGQRPVNIRFDDGKTKWHWRKYEIIVWLCFMFLVFTILNLKIIEVIVLKLNFFGMFVRNHTHAKWSSMKIAVNYYC